MQEMINQVMQRAGISPEQAKTAVETVVNFLKGQGGQFAGLTQMLGSLGGKGDAPQGEMPAATDALGGLGKKFGL